MRLKSKTAIITGGASGFGEGMVRRFAAEGARVMIADLDADRGSTLAGEVDGTMFHQTDVADGASVAALVAATLSAFGSLDILVNNAGIAQRNGPMLEVDEATFDRLYAVNVKSIYLAALYGVPALRARGGGSILNTASTAAVSPRPGLTWYNGTKGAVMTLTKSMALELAPDNIRVNAISPVLGETGLTAEFMGGRDTPEMREKFIGTIPLGRMSTPEDVANAALYLVSDEATLLTGVCLPVDGGRTV